ncbi:LAP2A protein, partial [Nothocercus julius]|nr:LAP2A protein [Nothocercus julius]
SEDSQSSYHKKARPSTATHFSEAEKNTLVRSIILPELATVLKDALTAAKQSITAVAQTSSHSIKHPRVPITEVPVVPLEATESNFHAFEPDDVESLNEQTASSKEKYKADQTLEDELSPEDVELSSQSSEQGEPDPVRKFDMEDQNYLFKHIRRVLVLKPPKSGHPSEELPTPSEEDKVDNALPIHSALENLVHRIWSNPEAKHEAPADLCKVYPLPADKAALWGALPEVDRAALIGDSVAANTDALPEDPADRKVEEAIKRSFKLAAAQLGVSIYCTYASKALLVWLKGEQDRVKKKCVQSTARQRTRRLCKIAANFIHDAAEDSLRLTVKNMACLTVAWRAIWLRPWASSLNLKCRLLSLPYTGGKLFGESAVKFLKDFSENQHSFHRQRKKRSIESSLFSYPHSCLSSFHSSSKFKGRKGKYKVSQSFHTNYKRTSQRDIRAIKSNF